MSAVTLDAFQVIADPSRRQILKLLSEESLSINSLAGNFQMSRPAVSKHIKVLEAAGFISIVNQGRERICQLHPVGFEELEAWFAYYEDFWAKRMKKLEELMNSRPA